MPSSQQIASKAPPSSAEFVLDIPIAGCRYPPCREVTAKLWVCVVDHPRSADPRYEARRIPSDGLRITRHIWSAADLFEEIAIGHRPFRAGLVRGRQRRGSMRGRRAADDHRSADARGGQNGAGNGASNSHVWCLPASKSELSIDKLDDRAGKYCRTVRSFSWTKC
jgi:hypothetical protein